jgi:hypothetical protein
MQTPAKIALFGGALAVVFAASLAVGKAVGPIGSEPQESTHTADAHTEDHSAGHGDSHADPAASTPAGLQVSERGYTLALADSIAPADPAAPLRFQILDAHGAPVTEYTDTHERPLHLIAVRRDFAGFQHLHPEFSDGTWSVGLDREQPGTYRVFADFLPAGESEQVTLGADLFVPGGFAPQPLPEPSRTAEVDGYTVTLAGDALAGDASDLSFTISRDGAPVTDLQPYLGAYGHLVVLREGDLAYLHAHPEDGPAGPEVAFSAHLPTDGSYRLFLDFQHDGVVRTAEFTVAADSH